MTKKYIIAIIGATGAVGREVLSNLEERNFPVEQIRALASNDSIGKSVSFRDQDIKVDVLDEKTDFGKIDLAFFCAGSVVTERYAGKAAEQGCLVVDKSSYFRLQEDVPLIVPEVNPLDVQNAHSQIVSNPNCCVIPLAVALKPLDSAAKIKRVVISTYQSVSGAGKKAMDELYNQTKAKFMFGEMQNGVLPKQIAFNLFPQVGDFLENGDSDEENKIALELQKILGSHVQSSVTCVRVPVFVSHSMSVNVEFEQELSASEAEEILSEDDALVVYNTSNKMQYATPIDVVQEDAVYVSRIRQDMSTKKAINMWVVCDNLRKGAALNAVQIAELMLDKG